MVSRALAVAIVLGACGGGGGGNNNMPHTVTVDVVGPGSVTSTPVGIDCPSSGCTGTFTDHVTLYAQPDNGATFVGWSGGCTGADPSCTVQLQNDQMVTAMVFPLSRTRFLNKDTPIRSDHSFTQTQRGDI